MKKINLKPGKEGYTMPAEWERHAATWLTWPHDEAHWPGKFNKVEHIWAQMAKELETGEDVHINIHDDATQKSAEKHLKKAGVTGSRIHFHRIPSNWSWARDHGPIFVKNKATGDVILTNWRFNGWGNKWKHDKDDDIPVFISTETNLPIVNVPMILEGGSISVNGKGTLLTTTSCLLNENRNPELEKEQIEQNLKDYLGVEKILWLGDGIVGDDTDGHVDDLTMFVGPSTVVTAIEHNKKDENYKALQENRKMLDEMTDQDGNSLTVHELPMPSPVIWKDTRLPATYANFYIGNDVILLPSFDDPHDAIAQDVMQKCFPDKRIAPIDTRDLVWGFGAFHCLTQQQPA